MSIKYKKKVPLMDALLKANGSKAGPVCPTCSQTWLPPKWLRLVAVIAAHAKGTSIESKFLSLHRITKEIGLGRHWGLCGDLDAAAVAGCLKKPWPDARLYGMTTKGRYLLKSWQKRGWVLKESLADAKERSLRNDKKKDR